MKKQQLISRLSDPESPEGTRPLSKWVRETSTLRSAQAVTGHKNFVPWTCGICGRELDPQYRPESTILCRQCKRIVCPACIAIGSIVTKDRPVCRVCHCSGL